MQADVGVIELDAMVFKVVDVELMVEDGAVLVLKPVLIDDTVKLSGTVPVPVPVPVAADEVDATVVTLVEEPCVRVITVDELQDAVEITVEVDVMVAVLVVV